MNVNEIISKTYQYLSEAVTAEKVKMNMTNMSDDYLKLISLITDIRFQTDFTLMHSAKEVQELYDRYRNTKTLEESNIEIRMLMDLAAYIRCIVDDNTPMSSVDKHYTAWTTYLKRLARLNTLHSDVDAQYTCQDHSFTDGMDEVTWHNLLKANPWLVAAVTIRNIPSYYLMDILTDNSLTSDES